RMKARFQKWQSLFVPLSVHVRPGHVPIVFAVGFGDSRRVILGDLIDVPKTMNAVQVMGDAVGTTLYYGKGAGSEPTASAVIADLVDVARLQTADPEHRVPHLAFQPGSMVNTSIMPMGEVTTSYYLRLRVADVAGVLADITRILADNGISIDAMLQREAGDGEKQTDLIMLTHETKEKNILAAIAKVEALKTVEGSVTKIRLENLS
ncbi:MAG: ACT domain-containing protein, partial [Polynucleobacter victoriensis]